MFRREPKLTTPEAIEAHRQKLIAEYVDFNKNWASGGGSDRQWANPDTAAGMDLIHERAERQLQRDLDEDKITRGVDSMLDTGAEARAAVMERPDFDRWLHNCQSVTDDGRMM